MYLKFYAQIEPESFPKLPDLLETQLEGLNWIDSSCEIHPTAKIGPNVMISPHCKIGEGVRLKNCILLPDVVI